MPSGTGIAVGIAAAAGPRNPRTAFNSVSLPAWTRPRSPEAVLPTDCEAVAIICWTRRSAFQISSVSWIRFTLNWSQVRFISRKESPRASPIGMGRMRNMESMAEVKSCRPKEMIARIVQTNIPMMDTSATPESCIYGRGMRPMIAGMPFWRIFTSTRPPASVASSATDSALPIRGVDSKKLMKNMKKKVSFTRVPRYGEAAAFTHQRAALPRKSPGTFFALTGIWGTPWDSKKLSSVGPLARGSALKSPEASAWAFPSMSDAPAGSIAANGSGDLACPRSPSALPMSPCPFSLWAKPWALEAIPSRKPAPPDCEKRRAIPRFACLTRSLGSRPTPPPPVPGDAFSPLRRA